MSKSTANDSRQITRIAIKEDKVIIGLVEDIPMDLNGTDEEEEKIVSNSYLVTSPRLPHKDFIDSMKKLRKLALDICDIKVDSVTDYTVSELKIAGDMALHQSRAVMVITKKLKRSTKLVKITTPQVAMFDETEYPSALELTKLIEEAVKEAELYLDGKSEEPGQLQLFMSPLEVAQ